jgi:hypothetical protein
LINVLRGLCGNAGDLTLSHRRVYPAGLGMTIALFLLVFNDSFTLSFLAVEPLTLWRRTPVRRSFVPYNRVDPAAVYTDLT